LSLIAEDAAELIQVRRAEDQPAPVIVPNLVPKVAEQGAVKLTHALAASLALGIIRFGEANGNDAVVVSGQDFRLSRSDIG
jgi:hypothetical protein